MRAKMQTIRDEAHAYVIRMLEQAVLARQRMFGASSEQLSAQSRLFDEAEVLAQASTTEQDTAPIAAEVPASAAQANSTAPAAKPARGKRAPLDASRIGGNTIAALSRFFHPNSNESGTQLFHDPIQLDSPQTPILESNVPIELI